MPVVIPPAAPEEATNSRPAQISALITGGIIAAGFGFCWAANWPGHLSDNSVVQLLEGRTGIYANWHPAVMSWMLGLADAVLAGTGLFVLFDAALVFGTLLLLLAIKPTQGWRAPVVAALLMATPQFLIYPGIVWKDVLFAGAMAAGFAGLALAAELWARRGLRLVLIAASFALFVLSALTRQNGIVVLLFGAGALGWLATRLERARRGAAYGGVALAAALVAAGASHWALASRVRGDLGPGAQIELLQSYDLIGALAADPGLKLDAIARADPGLDELMRGDGVRLYTPQRNDPLGGSEALADALDAAPPASSPDNGRRSFSITPRSICACAGRRFAGCS